MERRKARGRKTADANGGLLWAPWRRAYVEGARITSCIFCFDRLSAAEARRRLILRAGDLMTVMLNRYPYNSGHLMIAPRRHVASPELLTPAERAELSEAIGLAVAALRRAYDPAGINLGANLGRAAGAGIADHMHWHAVPRWEGDNNFMPVIAGTRVLPEMLEETFKRLAPLFKTGGLPVS